ncbi:MAG: hypothetical protein COA58_07970 [Bacteroidetes bacterium]|nr:MAG: hypothetical protein COA58_07970 [Bacteroidota bacterium]
MGIVILTAAVFAIIYYKEYTSSIFVGNEIKKIVKVIEMVVVIDELYLLEYESIEEKIQD